MTGEKAGERFCMYRNMKKVRGRIAINIKTYKTLSSL